jgi:hypothetical protein
VNRVLVGNKNDDPERKVVLTEDARRFADQMGIQGSHETIFSKNTVETRLFHLGVDYTVRF